VQTAQIQWRFYSNIALKKWGYIWANTCVGSVRLFVLYCGQGSSLYSRPNSDPMRMPREKRDGVDW